MDSRVDNHTYVNHEEEWQERFRNWAMSEIRAFTASSLVPSDAIFLTTQKGEDGTLYFYFKVVVPKPRSLSALDGLIARDFTNFCESLDTFVADKNNYHSYLTHLLETIFVSELEADWYYKHRLLSLKGEAEGKRIVLELENRK